MARGLTDEENANIRRALAIADKRVRPQRELGTKIGIDQSHVSAMLRPNSTRGTTYQVAKALAGLLGITTDALLEGRFDDSTTAKAFERTVTSAIEEDGTFLDVYQGFVDEGFSPTLVKETLLAARREGHKLVNEDLRASLKSAVARSKNKEVGVEIAEEDDDDLPPVAKKQPTKPKLTKKS